MERYDEWVLTLETLGGAVLCEQFDHIHVTRQQCDIEQRETVAVVAVDVHFIVVQDGPRLFHLTKLDGRKQRCV